MEQNDDSCINCGLASGSFYLYPVVRIPNVMLLRGLS